MSSSNEDKRHLSKRERKEIERNALSFLHTLFWLLRLFDLFMKLIRGSKIVLSSIFAVRLRSRIPFRVSFPEPPPRWKPRWGKPTSGRNTIRADKSTSKSVRRRRKSVEPFFSFTRVFLFFSPREENDRGGTAEFIHSAHTLFYSPPHTNRHILETQFPLPSSPSPFPFFPPPSDR